MIKILVLALRGVSIGARFVLSFLFVKYISLEFQGEYALLLTTITILTLAVGADFYVYSNRYMIKNKDQTGFTLINQFVFHLFAYALLVLLFFILNYLGAFQNYVTVAVLFLLIFEHLGMEFFRAFIALEKQLVANIILFVRTGIWPLIVIFQLLFTDMEVTLNSIILYWVLASVLSVIISFLFIYKEVFSTKFAVDKKWIFQGMKVAALFFAGTIAQKIIEFSDRYIIDAFLGAKSLGIYSFYFQLANLANVFIFTVLISFLYPKIIFFINNKEKKEAFAVIKKLQTQSVLFIVGYTLLLTFILPYFLDFLQKEELYEHKIILYIFLLGNLFYNLSFASHYALMAIEKDRQLMWITIGVAVINLAGNLIAVSYFGLTGAVVVFLVSALLLYVVKRQAEKIVFKKYDW